MRAGSVTLFKQQGRSDRVNWMPDQCMQTRRGHLDAFPPMQSMAEQNLGSRAATDVADADNQQLFEHVTTSDISMTGLLRSRGASHQCAARAKHSQTRIAPSEMCQFDRKSPMSPRRRDQGAFAMLVAKICSGASVPSETN